MYERRDTTLEAQVSSLESKVNFRHKAQLVLEITATVLASVAAGVYYQQYHASGDVIDARTAKIWAATTVVSGVSTLIDVLATHYSYQSTKK